MNIQNTEFETKVIDINIIEIIAKLRALGAQESSEFLAKRYVYDLSTEDIGWIRLRQSIGPATMTYKFKEKGNTVVGKTIEIEVEVSDFEKTAQILSKVPCKEVYYQENKSHLFNLNGIEFSIDSWPHIAPYLEVESTSIEKVQEGLGLLGLEGKDVGDKDIKIIYAENGIDIHSFKELKF
ncbi:MAG: hypothetical protein M3Q44_06120 [bacterium]|nr:hypothetical protein [bacterium]